MAADGQYRARVRADGGGWSEVHFTVDAVLELLSPKDGTEISEAPTFKWEVSSAVLVNYEFQLARDQDFNDVHTAEFGLLTNEYTLSSTPSEGKYYWRVRVKDSHGQEGDWNRASFTVVTEGMSTGLLVVS